MLPLTVVVALRFKNISWTPKSPLINLATPYRRHCCIILVFHYFQATSMMQNPAFQNMAGRMMQQGRAAPQNMTEMM